MPLADQCGVVLGKLFGRLYEGNESPEPATLDAGASNAIVASCGRRLFQHYWGRYVAFVRGQDAETTWILRDPSGGLPCYYTQHDGVDVFFSFVEGFLALGWLELSVDWRQVAEIAACNILQVRQTGLDGVQELAPGECIELAAGHDKKVMLYWEPVEIARTASIEDISEAARMLRRTTHQCIAAWAGCYPRVLHRLSGGLDSAIVLDGLIRSTSRPHITCINAYELSPWGDERTYARQAANQAGCELVEWELDPATLRKEDLLQASRSVRPCTHYYYCKQNLSEGALAADRRASAVFTGEGGDTNFYSGQPLLPVADYVRQHGLRPGVWRIALEAAPAARVSVWYVLRHAIRQGLLQRHHSAQELLTQLLAFAQDFATADILELRRTMQLTHPWLMDGKSLARGKLWHLLSMSFPPPFYDPMAGDDAPEVVHPLLSQPIVELCLRIPTWVLATGGRNRALARIAFSEGVPPAIIARRDKGNIGPFLVRFLKHNASFVRELLCDGQLAKAGIIDRRRIERFFSSDGSHAMLGAAGIAYYMNLEAWLGSWAHARQETRATV